MIGALIFTIAAVIAAFGHGESSAIGLGVVAGVLWVAVVGVGIWFFIEFGCLRGTVGANRYGPDPVLARNANEDNFGAMRGNVIGFDPDTNIGAISGYDGNRYDFVTLEWRAPTRSRGMAISSISKPWPISAPGKSISSRPQYVTPNFGQFYFSPAGRISRSQYWLRFMLPYFGITFVLEASWQAASAAKNSHQSPALMRRYPDDILPSSPYGRAIAILVKRIHDRNKSGWLCLGAVHTIVSDRPWFSSVLAGFIWRRDVASYAAASRRNPRVSPARSARWAIAVGVDRCSSLSAGIGIWFLVEFGCMRGTVGANRFGPRPGPLKRAQTNKKGRKTRPFFASGVALVKGPDDQQELTMPPPPKSSPPLLS